MGEADQTQPGLQAYNYMSELLPLNPVNCVHNSGLCLQDQHSPVHTFQPTNIILYSYLAMKKMEIDF